jgi:hypothetical protein
MGQKSAGGIMQEDVPKKREGCTQDLQQYHPKYIAMPKPSADAPALPSALPICGEEFECHQGFAVVNLKL